MVGGNVCDPSILFFFFFFFFSEWVDSPVVG